MGFVPLDEVETPALPAQEWFRSLLGRALALVGRGGSKPFIADDHLKRATLEMLDQVVAPPACGTVLDELEETVAAWLAEEPRVSNIKLIVLPPCDESDLITTWANAAGHQILPTPPRDTLIEPQLFALPALDGEGLLVLPRLENWFLRHRNGLRPVRALLAALDASGRLAVVGCNSWAWAFLARAAAADQLLPDPVTFAAFDAPRLLRWFAELARREFHFRRAATGQDVLEADEDGAPKDDFLRVLAGRSLGIPWVAWHMWRRALRSEASDSPAEDAKAALTEGEQPSQQTLWVAALEELLLPGKHEQSVLLVLHALLIHGALDAAHLRLVLPIVGESNIVSVLVGAGFVARDGDAFSVRPAAYPAIRAGLERAGLPLDGVG